MRRFFTLDLPLLPVVKISPNINIALVGTSGRNNVGVKQLGTEVRTDLMIGLNNTNTSLFKLNSWPSLQYIITLDELNIIVLKADFKAALCRSNVSWHLSMMCFKYLKR